MFITAFLFAASLTTGSAPAACSFNGPEAGITQLADGEYRLCAIVSAVYETEGQALDGAIGGVRARAATLCNGVEGRAVSQPKVSLAIATQVKVQQVFTCDAP